MKNKLSSQNISSDTNVLDGFLQDSVKTGCAVFFGFFNAAVRFPVMFIELCWKHKTTKRQPKDRLNPWYRRNQIAVIWL